jgi:hypothetical protein
MTHSDEIDRLIAEVAKRHGVLLGRADPAFILFTISRELIDRASDRLDQRMSQRLSAFEQSVGSAESRAGTLLAAAVREFLAASETALTNRKQEARQALRTHVALAVGILSGAAATICVLRIN